MLNAVSNSEVPHLTVILGNSYGASTYAMSGREFSQCFTFLLANSKDCRNGRGTNSWSYVDGKKSKSYA